MENLDHLEGLKVLRMGRNKIASKVNGFTYTMIQQFPTLSFFYFSPHFSQDDIIYLRQLPGLKTLSIKENPYCEAEEDWQGFIMALLPGT